MATKYNCMCVSVYIYMYTHSHYIHVTYIYMYIYIYTYTCCAYTDVTSLGCRLVVHSCVPFSFGGKVTET